MCHKMVGGLVALLGLAFLLGNLGLLSMSTVSMAWPILLILIGLKKMMGGACKCC